MSRGTGRVALVGVVLASSAVACSTAAGVAPECGVPDDASVVLLAQAVPSATLVPCVGTVPAGWAFDGSEIRDGEATLWLRSVEAGRVVELRFTATCDPGDAIEVVPGPDEAGATVYQAPETLNPFRGTRYVVFDGGCVTTTYTFPAGLPASQALEADLAFSFVVRADVVAAVAESDGAILCGAAAPPCEGG